MARPSYKGHADFQAAHTLAKYAAAFELGLHWKLVPGASVRARLPAAWVTHKVGVMQSNSVNGSGTKGRAIRTCRTPRDVRLPAACFWENGLPIGPEYFAEYDWEAAAQIELANTAD